jgi:hypothetical protein
MHLLGCLFQVKSPHEMLVRTISVLLPARDAEKAEQPAWCSVGCTKKPRIDLKRDFPKGNRDALFSSDSDHITVNGGVVNRHLERFDENQSGTDLAL